MSTSKRMDEMDAQEPQQEILEREKTLRDLYRKVGELGTLIYEQMSEECRHALSREHTEELYRNGSLSEGG